MHYIFVDFENVPSVDLNLIAGRPVHVTLLIGQKQKRLTLDLVKQIHQYASQVRLIEVGASGRNALDMVLAAHVGRATVEQADAEFVIISNDKDFDPLIAHLRGLDHHVARYGELSAAPFLAAEKRTASGKGVGGTKSATGVKGARTSVPAALPTAVTAAPLPEDRMAKLIQIMGDAPANRPRRRKTLRAHIKSFFGPHCTDADGDRVVAELERRGVLTVTPDDHVTYR